MPERAAGRRPLRAHPHLSLQPDVPDPPENLRLSDRQDRSVRLSWEAGDEHNSNITGRDGLGAALTPDAGGLSLKTFFTRCVTSP